MNPTAALLLCAMLTVATTVTGCDPTTDPVPLADAGGDTHTDTAKHTDAGTADVPHVDGGPDTTADVATDTLTVRILSGSVGWDDGAPKVPLAAVMVAFDGADGTRVEAETGVDGVVTFDDPDLSGDGGAVIAYRWGYGVTARVGITDTDEEVVLVLSSPTPPETVLLSGTAKGMTDEGNILVIHASIPGASVHETTGASWTMKVPAGKPFTLVAEEYAIGGGDPVSDRGLAKTTFAVTSVSSPGVTEPGTLEIDFGQPMPTTTAIGSFPIPQTGFFKDTGKGYIYGTTAESGEGVWLAGLKRVDVSADGLSFEYEHVTVELPDATPLTRYGIMEQLWQGRVTWTTRAGVPPDGAQDIPLATPVDPLVPGAGAGPHPIDQPIEWDLEPDDETMDIMIAVTSADALATIVHAPAGTRQVTLPALPTGAVAAEVFGMMPKATIRTCSIDPALAPAPFCERLAIGRSFRLAY